MESRTADWGKEDKSRYNLDRLPLCMHRQECLREEDLGGRGRLEFWGQSIVLWNQFSQIRELRRIVR